MISKRVQLLREYSIDTTPYISPERAVLLTDFYQNVSGTVSTPVARALAFKYILEHKTIYIGEGELIVGERGPAPKATPTYPELCCHTLEDLHVLHSRARQPFLVDDITKKVYEEKVIPFWSGKTMRDRIFAAVSPEWKNAFDAGVFTEFMEQRAPGHAVLDDKIYYTGFKDFKYKINTRINTLDYFSDDKAYKKEQELTAMRITADALILYAHRHAQKARELAKKEENPERKKELQKIADICTHVPEYPPRTFWEALQMYWFVHLGVIIELNVWDSFNPGRLDQHLYPFYIKDIEDGVLSEEYARELLQCFWIKFNNQPAPPKVDITEEQSGTYQDFALINVGGLTPEEKMQLMIYRI